MIISTFDPSLADLNLRFNIENVRGIYVYGNLHAYMVFLLFKMYYDE